MKRHAHETGRGSSANQLPKVKKKLVAAQRREKHYRAALKAVAAFMDEADYSKVPDVEWSWFYGIRRFVSEGLELRPLVKRSHPRKP